MEANALDSDRNTPLHDATACGNTDVVKMLLPRTANVNAKNIEGHTPLRQAGIAGSQGCFDLIRSRRGQG